MGFFETSQLFFSTFIVQIIPFKGLSFSTSLVFKFPGILKDFIKPQQTKGWLGSCEGWTCSSSDLSETYQIQHLCNWALFS